MFPDRIVIGGIDERSIALIDTVYASFPDTPRIKTNPSTAELIKYASNALLANLISFANEISNVGSALGGIDAIDVMRGLHLSHYFKERDAGGLPPITAFLYPGCGFGGSCLPKDVKALIAHGRSAGESMPLLEAVIRINEGQPGRIVALLQKHWPSLQQVRVTVLGLAFKPGTGDLRESPAFPIMHELLEQGAVLKAHDPVATQDARRTFARPGVTYCDDLESALADADAVIIVTPWKEFRRVPALLRDSSRPVVFVDARRAFDKGSVVHYDGVGL
jgi:UDPglucose 6-dehydrogenase/GDP-mannose 6-dehydrogenase